MTFSMATVAFAQETKADELLLAELKQEVKEINEYLQQNMKPLDIKNQTAKQPDTSVLTSQESLQISILISTLHV